MAHTARAILLDAGIEFCETLPRVGGITKYHLAKNLGVDVAKPDVWLERVAAKSGETVHELCGRLSKQSRRQCLDSRLCDLESLSARMVAAGSDGEAGPGKKIAARSAVPIASRGIILLAVAS